MFLLIKFIKGNIGFINYLSILLSQILRIISAANLVIFL